MIGRRPRPGPPPIGPVPDERLDPVRVIDAALRAATEDRKVAADHSDITAWLEANDRVQRLLEERFRLAGDRS